MNEHSDQFALIDRLATGDLDGPARRELFTWLDCEPSRWRRCALALLEAGELERALDDWQAEVPRPTAACAPAVERSRRPAMFALAASVLIAFSLGAFARDFWTVPVPMMVELPKPAGGETSAAAANKKSSPEVVKRADKASDKTVTAVAAAPPGAAQADLIPPYIRSQWERRGYQLTSRPARLPVVLPNGRRVMVPVDELQVNYVGQRTY
ncbi:MAG TPA: hypothetical protein VNH11_15790 [Pirellulales bacterium]|nr:hypothetical protein [Pirellulales bacterium]